jgi:hypothetical protein
MEQVIITGVDASGLIGKITGMGTEIRSIEIDVPLDEVGTTDPRITLSGVLTGVYSFRSDTTLNLRYGTEDIYITSSGFTAEYSAIIRYVTYGDQTYTLNTRNMSAIPLPSRLTSRTPRS